MFTYFFRFNKFFVIMKRKQKRSTFGAICEDVMKKHGSAGTAEDKRDFSFVKSSRKQKRKEKRNLLKQRKAGLVSDKVQTLATDLNDSIAEVKIKSKNLNSKTKSFKKAELPHSEPKSDNYSLKAGVEDEFLNFKSSVEKTRKRRIAGNLNAEDKTIHQLEKKLRINTKKKNKLPSSFKADGFDYILDLIGDSNKETLSNHKNGFSSNTEKKNSKVEKAKEDFFDSGSEESDGQEEDISDQDEDVGSDSVEEEMKDSSENDSDAEEDKFDVCDNKITDQELSVTSQLKYIPPALRNLGDGKNISQLQRQLKGLLNRVSESNLNRIANDIEQMYRENSRAIMNKVFSELIMTLVFQADPIPDKLNLEYAMLVCVVSRRVAIEILAYMLEDIVCKLNDVLKDGKYENDKSTNNATALICNFYRLKITHSTLPINLLNLLSDSLTEKNVELILNVLRLVGFQLRQDDPVSFKDIVQRIVAKAGELDEADGSRMSYMMDTLTAIKNNNARKLTQYYDPEMVKQIRKKVFAAVGNSSSASARLPAVTMDDFVNGDTNGRWWVVGSAWAGAPMLKKKEEQEPATHEVSSKLVEAARKQRMNTDLRRSIFYAIMTADDFVNAFEKILSLGLKDRQEQEIPHVIVECCQQGKQYNAFYCHLLTKFCGYDRQNILRTQCSFWDRFKLLSDFKRNQILNLARLLADLVFNASVPLSILKNIDFTQLDVTTANFLRLFFKYLIEKPSVDNEILKVVSKLSQNKKYRMVSQGLILFIKHFILNEETFENETDIYKNGIMNILNALKSSTKLSAISL